MVRKIRTIEPQLSANAVTRGDSVVLVANLSDLEWEDLKAQGGHIEFSVENTILTPSASDPKSAEWKTTGTTAFRPSYGEASS